MSNVSRLRIRSILLSSVLLFSIILNGVLFVYAKRYYSEHAMVRLDPLGLNYYAQERGVMPVNRPRTVVLYGDSRVVDWAPPEIAQTVFINRGVHSQTSAQVLLRYEAHVAPLRPDVLVLQVGVNDLKTLAVFPKWRARVVAQCMANIEKIVQAATQQGAQVIITTIFPVGRAPLYKKPLWSADIALAVEEVNDYLRTLQGVNVTVFDAWALLADDDGLLQTQYAPDELHLNAAAYTHLNRSITALLRK